MFYINEKSVIYTMFGNFRLINESKNQSTRLMACCGWNFKKKYLGNYFAIQNTNHYLKNKLRLATEIESVSEIVVARVISLNIEQSNLRKRFLLKRFNMKPKCTCSCLVVGLFFKTCFE